MLLFSGHERDRQVLGDVVFAVRLLDDEAVLGDGFFLGLEDAADHVHDIGRVGGRLQAFLAHFQRETARNGAAELLDAVTQPLGVGQFFLNVRGQRLLDEFRPHAFEVQAVGQVVEHRLNFHVVRLQEVGHAFLLGHCHGLFSCWF